MADKHLDRVNRIVDHANRDGVDGGARELNDDERDRIESILDDRKAENDGCLIPVVVGLGWALTLMYAGIRFLS